ncbi:hypothetical protein CARUB_v10011291mg [Capsella rubella]|uniref:F-box associated beta-propeller type 3 domain-containing protein n=1 Tax=Capsella rubella TaxID=81985 RepID=R0IE81_9BRAS|nr:hypothetical protein CARUB_v10011291mg [Capsella rubella]
MLLRLPEKSVARFRCVSKLWLSITKDPYFIKLFETHSRLYVSSIPQHRHSLQTPKRSYSISQPIYRYHMKFPTPAGHSNFPSTESVHGLICFNVSATPIVWNPSTRQILTLTKPRLSWNELTIFLGYDPVEGKHKVMCIPRKRSSDVCRVLTLGSAQESWRTVKTYHTHRSNYHTSGRCIKGVVYYIAYIYHTHVWVIMSFDVRSEKFDMLQVPSENISKDVFMTYEGRLACVESCVTLDGRLIPNWKHGNRLYILEDAKKHKWFRKDVLAPTGGCFDDRLRNYFQLKGYTHDGEFVYVSSTFREMDYILFCDPIKNSFRRFELEGIADGVSNRRIYALHAFPDHVDSQITLY